MRIARVRIHGAPESHTSVHMAVEAYDEHTVRGRVIPDPFLFSSAGLSSSAGSERKEADLCAYPTITATIKDLLPPGVPPRKVICVGLNFREHITEMGHPIPEYPTLFSKFPDTLTSPFSRIAVPPWMRDALDYEGELAIIIGPSGTIAGYTVAQDFSQRDWQYRTQQWLQGKNLYASSALGPWMLSADSFDPVAAGSILRTWVNGQLRQQHSLADLVFQPQELVDYIQAFTPLGAGDVVLTGTPAGVGHGKRPPVYLQDGDVVRVGIEGIGDIESTVYFPDEG